MNRKKVGWGCFVLDGGIIQSSDDAGQLCWSHQFLAAASQTEAGIFSSGGHLVAELVYQIMSPRTARLAIVMKMITMKMSKPTRLATKQQSSQSPSAQMGSF